MSLDNYSNEGRNYPMGTTNVSPINSNAPSNGFNLGNLGWGTLGNMFGAWGANQSANDAQAGLNGNFNAMNNAYWQNGAKVDNFAPMRPYALQQLLALQQNPGQYLQSERFQAPLAASMDEMRRKQAQQGMLGSGNSMAELQQLAQVTGLRALTDRENQLSKWAGGDFNLNQLLQGDASMRAAQMGGMAGLINNNAATSAAQFGQFGSMAADLGGADWSGIFDTIVGFL